jgi:hypothetical protein
LVYLGGDLLSFECFDSFDSQEIQNSGLLRLLGIPRAPRLFAVGSTFWYVIEGPNFWGDVTMTSAFSDV